jgi:uncharacterized protein
MARARSVDPRRLDLAAFAEAGATLEGDEPQSAFTRLSEGTLAAADTPPAAVRWQAAGALRPVAGGPPEVWLHLHAQTVVMLECQRCLQPLALPVEVDRRFRFAAGEDEAARLDEESEDDVLALSHAFDLPALIEDELILALPLVPRHDVCPEPLPMAPADTAEEEAAHPFAALAALKRTPS